MMKEWLSVKDLLHAAALAVALTAVGPGSGAAFEEGGQGNIVTAGLIDLDLEELMAIEVYSVAKRVRSLGDSAAAAYVLTNEDIRRSGATSIAEALRLVPGVQVARIDSNKWAITVRGFNERFANKLLVLIDGRSVYTPLFAGVYWDQQDTLLEDVDRIEVIRGPGGTLWGANAVNGVINIITKDAGDTQGGLVAGGMGTEENSFAGFRHGGRLGERAHYRVYAKHFDRDNFTSADRGNTDDEWNVGRGGFRIDWRATDVDDVTVHGDMYEGSSGSKTTFASLGAPGFTETEVTDSNIAGGNVLAAWKRKQSEESELRLQFFYDRTERRDRVSLTEYRDTIDLEFQNSLAVGSAHEFIWGLGYRFGSDEIDNSTTLTFAPSSREIHLFSAFIQDDMSFVGDRLRLTLGSKFEHNDFTGFEVQPNARFLWKPADHQTLWGAVSRAVRTPSRAEVDLRIDSTILPPGSLGPGTPATIVALFGERDYDSEKLLAWELGYRMQASSEFFVDIAAFYNDYDDLRSLAQRPSDPPFPEDTHLVLPFFAGNFIHGETYGVEVSTDLRLSDNWRLNAGYSYIDINLTREAEAATDTISEGAEGASPHHQFVARSFFDLGRNLEVDGTLRYVDNLPSEGVSSYLALDARLGWRPSESLELSLVGQNLFDGSHTEFAPSAFVSSEATETQRSVYGKITWRY
ncbi:MAG: TonB-dependent receptor plug domain-containing protein [Candidatus Binatia bacterium]